MEQPKEKYKEEHINILQRNNTLREKFSQAMVTTEKISRNENVLKDKQLNESSPVVGQRGPKKKESTSTKDLLKNARQ